METRCFALSSGSVITLGQFHSMSCATQIKSTKGVVKYSWIALFIAILSYCYNYVWVAHFLFPSRFSSLPYNGSCDSDSPLQAF